MPPKVRRFYTSVLLVFVFSILTYAQTSADVMRERVAKAKAFIAVRNYNAAIYELENIRRETNDQTVHGVINVLLMNSFLEQGDYKRAQDFLTELSKSKQGAASYYTVAAQVVKGARNQVERYKSLGLSVGDPSLPKEAVADVDKMRETLEKVVEQSKTLSKDKNQTSNAMALMEEATAARGSLARDTYDAARWKNEAADAREDLANARSVVVSAVDGTQTPAQTPPTNNNIAANTPPTNNAATNPPQVNQNTNQTVSLQPVPTDKPVVAKIEPTEKQTVAETPKVETKRADEPATVAQVNSNQPDASSRTRRVENAETPKIIETPKVAANTSAPKNDEPLPVGSLVGYATKKENPVYPAMAKNMRMTGVVKVELIVDENGQVAEVQNTSGPMMLQRAAMDAVKKWRFKPFTRDGQATRAAGFVSFNFSL